MSYQVDKNDQDIKQNKTKSRSEMNPGREMFYSGLPNSIRLSASVPPGIPNSIMREMLTPQIPAAEDEADRLSAGITSGTPDSVRREMAGRLGSDFSSVRFHSGPESVRRNEAMGARAYTKGSDVYFGRGGFEPRVAAHELVHTVQQGAAKGSVTQNVAAGTVQRFWFFGSKKKSKYDVMKGPSEEADFLFRTQAGISASLEKQRAERDEAYEKEFSKEIGKGRNENYAARKAQNKSSRLKTKNKSIVSQSDQDQFTDKIRSISFDTYKELVQRRDQEAGKLVDTYKDLFLENDDKDKSASIAANSEEGRNYSLYNTIIQKIELEHSEDEAFSQWRTRIQNDSGKDPAEIEKTRRMAKGIINLGRLSARNKYHMTNEGVKSRTAADKENEKYYKEIYKGKRGPKKKNKLDRMADFYRQSGFGKNNGLIIENDRDSMVQRPGFLDEDNSEDNIIRNDTGNDIFQNNSISGRDSVSEGGMKEKDDESFSDEISTNSILNKGMIEFGDDSFGDNNILHSSKNTGTEKDILDIAFEQEKQQDPTDIVRQKGVITEELVNKFVPSDAMIGKGKKLNSKIGYYNNLGKSANNIAQIALTADNIDIKNGNNIYANVINPAVGGAAGLLGLVTGAAGLYTGFHDTKRNFKNVAAGGGRTDYINSGLDTLGSGSAMLAGGLTAMQNAGNIPVVGNTLAAAGKFAGSDFVPGLNIATGGLTALTGAIQGIGGQRSINKIDKQIDELKKRRPKKKDAEDQKKLMKIFRQGRRVAELRRTGGGIKFMGGGITAGTGLGVALASGPIAPLTLAILAAVGTTTGIGKYIYDKKKKKNLRKDVTAEEMGINWDKEIKRVKTMFRDENLSDKEARAVILKGHGFEEGTRTAAFKKINQNRAKTLMDTFKKGGKIGELSQKVISALGVHRKKGRYAEGAEKLLAEKLGG